MENAPERCTEQEIKIHKLNQQILDQLEATNVGTEQVENEKSQIDEARFKMGWFPKAIAKLLRRYDPIIKPLLIRFFDHFELKMEKEQLLNRSSSTCNPLWKTNPQSYWPIDQQPDVGTDTQGHGRV